MSYYYSANFSDLIGKTLKKIEVYNRSNVLNEIIFECNDGSIYKMYHSQDCCENVDIEDIGGDIQEILKGIFILKS